MHEILLRETLIRNGLCPHKDVSLLRVDFFDMGRALARGDIQAFLSGEPFPSLAVSRGFGRILSYPYYNQSIGMINAGMLVTQASLRANPEKVYQLVKAHALASYYLTRHPDEWLSKASEFGVPRSTLEKARPNIELAWDMDPDFLRKVKALGRRMQELGMIGRQPDYEQLFELSMVTRVRQKIRSHFEPGS
jgi:NitT/TauT family transport system substrate-binding protein